VSVINVDRCPERSDQLVAPMLVIQGARRIGFFKRLLFSMHRSRRAQAARIIEEHRRLEALFARRDD